MFFYKRDLLKYKRDDEKEIEKSIYKWGRERDREGF